MCTLRFPDGGSMCMYIQWLYPIWKQCVATLTVGSLDVCYSEQRFWNCSLFAESVHFCCRFPRCLAIETVTYELSAMRLKILIVEADLQATKAELREIKGKRQSFIQSDRKADEIYLLETVFWSLGLAKHSLLNENVLKKCFERKKRYIPVSAIWWQI